MEIFQKCASCGAKSRSKSTSHGQALLGSGREQVNDLRIVATRGPHDSDAGACPKPILLRVLAPRKLAVQRVDFKSRTLGAGQCGAGVCLCVGGWGECCLGLGKGRV